MSKKECSLIRYVVLCLCIFSPIVSANDLPDTAPDPAQAMIKGFAKYQAGRVENLVLENFVDELKQKGYFRFLFAKTSRSVGLYDGISGKRLIPLLQEYFNKDLSHLVMFSDCLSDQFAMLKESDPAGAGKKSAAKIKVLWKNLGIIMKYYAEGSGENQAYSESLKQEVTKSGSNAVKDLNYLLELVAGEDIDSCRVRDIDEVSKENQQANAGVQEEKEKILASVSKVETSLLMPVSEPVKSRATVLAAESRRMNLSKSLDKIKEIIKSDTDLGDKEFILLHNEINNIQSNSFADSSTTMIELEVSSLVDAHKILTEKQANQQIVKQAEAKSKVAALTELLTSIESVNDDLRNKLAGYKEYDKLKSSALFLASLSDAAEGGDNNAANSVASVIADFVDEEAAYKSKRRTAGLIDFDYAQADQIDNEESYSSRFNPLNYRFGEGDWLYLSSYFGVAGNFGLHSDNGGNADSGDYRARAYGPVGIEIKLGTLKPMSWLGGTIGLNASPFDIGAYVSNELSGEDYDARIEDIKSPSYFLSWTLRNQPVAFLLGIQKNLKLDDGQRYDTKFISVAFDLPIFKLK